MESRERVLITGGTGFIGKRLVRYLLDKNCIVRLLVRDARKVYFSSDVQIVEGDLTQSGSLLGSCTDVDTVYHLAGYAHAWAENNSQYKNDHYAINFEGTKNLLSEANRAKVKKFIFFSSVKAVADSDNIIDENWTELPTSAYGIAKREAESLILTRSINMHVCCLRLSLVYGPEWKGNLASMLHAVDRGIFLPLPSIDKFRSMVSVDDVCNAAFLAANNPEANGKIYFLTDGVFYTTRAIYDLMREALGKRVPKWHIPMWVFKLLAYFGDAGGKLIRRRMPFNSEALSKLFGSALYGSQRIQNELGFKPVYDFKKMLPFIISAYKNKS